MIVENAKNNYLKDKIKLDIGKVDQDVEIKLYYLRKMQRNMQEWVKWRVIIKRRNKNDKR